MSFVVKTYEQIRDAALLAIGSRTSISNFNVGSVVRTWTEAFSARLADVYLFAAEFYKNGFVDTATGFWLDRKAKEYGLTRQAAVTTRGNVSFYRNIAKSTNVTIPAGTIVKTLQDSNGIERRYTVDEETILASGETAVDVAVIAETSGEAYNVGSGSISVLATYITGIDGVTNESDWITITGTDTESDDDLRSRCILAWEELSTGGTAAVYVSWALSVDGVASAFVDDTMPRGDGTIDVYIMGDSGIPDPALIAAVQAVVDENRPITADALVLAPGTVSVDITLSVVPMSGYVASEVDADIRHRLDVYFSDVTDDEESDITPLGVGKDVVLSRIIAIVANTTGVYSVEVTDPSSDVEVDPSEFPAQGTVDITMEAPSEE